MERRQRSSWAVVGLSLAALSLLPTAVQAQGGPAAAGPWAQTVSAAQREAKVVLYSSVTPQATDRIVAAFRKAHPEIAIESSRMFTGAAISRIDQEHASGADGGDVWLGADGGWFAARAKEGSLLKAAGPALKDWPSEAMLAGSVVIGGREVFTINYNKALVPNPPQSYADLLRPEFKNVMGSVENASAVQLAWYMWLERTQGSGYLAKLKAQNLKLYASGPQTVQALVSGEIAVMAGAGGLSVAKPLADQGAPIAWAMPNPAFGHELYLAVFGWSKRQNAAQVLVDFIMSVEGQTAWHRNGDSASPRPGIPGSLPFSAITPFDFLSYTPEQIAKDTQFWNSIFK